MAEQLELNTSNDAAPSEREKVLRDFGKDFSENKRQSDASDRRAESNPQPDAAAEGTGDAPADTGTNARARDEKGKFAPKPEPFDGFSKLDPKIQEQFSALTKERDRLKGDYAAVAGRLPGVQREVETLRARLQQPNQTPKSQQSSQLKLDDLLKSEKWQQFANRYPEDAEGVKEGLQATVDSLVSRFSDSANPLNEKIQQLESRLGELDTREQVKVAQQTTDRLSDEHPEWRKIAGWEDDDGNYIADPARRQWHPWFSAWRDQLPPIMQRNYDQLLGSLDADSISYVLSHFKRDVQAAMGQSGTSPAPASDELAQRRAEALRDTSPRPSRSGADPAQNQFAGRDSDAGDRLAILDRYLKPYQAGQRI